MTFWKVDLLKADAGTQRTDWFRNSSDAALFCDSVSGDIYENAYYCREVRIPNVVLDAAERQAQAKAQAVVPLTRQDQQAEVADPLASMRLAS